MDYQNRNNSAVMPVESGAVPGVAWAQPYLLGEPQTEQAAVPLSHYLWILRRHRWKMLTFVLVCLVATAIISSRMTPIYESTATVDVDRQSPHGVVGQESARNMLNDAEQFLSTQVRLIQSDSVLRPVAEQFGLLEHEGQAGHARTPAPASAEEAPVMLRQLKVSRPPNTYLLLISYRSTDPRLAAEVANAVARSYLEHTYNIRIRSSASLSTFMEKQLEELRAKMERSSMALTQFERELNVINPEEKTSILSARLLQLNTEYTNAQADRVRKEAAFNSIRTGSLEAVEASEQGEDLRKLNEHLNAALQKFAEVKVQFGANHPEYRRAHAQLMEVQRAFSKTRDSIAGRVEVEYRQALNREAMLEKAVRETKAEFDRLNARSFEYQSLKREAEADKTLYEELVRKIREASINSGFQNSAIRIADLARPSNKPVFPNLKLNLLLAFLISSLLAVGAAILSDILDNTIRDPEQVKRTMKAEVVGTLPVVRQWRGRLGPAAPNGNGATGLVRVARHGEDETTGFSESVRTLRNSILLADVDRRFRSLLVTSASPGEGKSTTAIHLALAHAEQGQKTLLIDGDLRRPSIHRRFNIPSTVGLSNVLLAEVPWREILAKPEATRSLDVLPAGPPSRRASDLVGRGLVELLEEAQADYDLVILDAPPMLGFAEPLQMATAVDGVLVVARAGETNRKAVNAVLATLQRLRATVVGLVLNGVHKELSDSYYYYSHYHKYYKSREAGKPA